MLGLVYRLELLPDNGFVEYMDDRPIRCTNGKHSEEECSKNWKEIESSCGDVFKLYRWLQVNRCNPSINKEGIQKWLLS